MAAESQCGQNGPIVDHNPVLTSYYESLESRIGWGLLLGGTRHAGYWDKDTRWPFPLSKALRRMEQRLFSRLRLPPGSRVLDAGCGDGQVALFLARKGLRVTGIDVVVRHLENSWRNIRKADLPAGQVEVLYADYHHLEHVPDASYDGVYAMETLLHATDPTAALGGFFRVLKPGGRLVLHESEHPDGAVDRCGGEKANRTAEINDLAAMSTNQVTTSGFYRQLLEEVGFAAIEEEDLSENIRPGARLIYALEIVPYYIITFFRLERYFINVIAGVRGFNGESPWSYVVMDATKPGGTNEDGLEKGEE